MSTIFVKDPDELKDYEIDWQGSSPGPRLETDETIADSTWIVPTGITEGTGTQASSNTDTTATIWLSGGTLDEQYDITNRVTTSAGRIYDQTIRIAILSR